MLDAKILTFLEVARLGSYTRAAECLHLTQPAVTQQIHRLEEHFGRRLAQYGWTAAIIAITVFLVVWAIGSFRPQKL